MNEVDKMSSAMSKMSAEIDQNKNEFNAKVDNQLGQMVDEKIQNLHGQFMKE